MQSNNAEPVVKRTPEQKTGSWTMRYSPFAFETFQGLPWPTWSFVMALLFLALIWRQYERRFDFSYPARMHGLAYFIHEERSKHPRKPEIVVVGSSVAGWFNAEAIQEKTGKISVNASSPGTTPWTNVRVLKKYPDEFKNTKVIVCDLDRWMFRNMPPYNPSNTLEIDRGRYLFMKTPFDFLRPSPTSLVPHKLTLMEKVVPIRHSVREILEYNFNEKEKWTKRPYVPPPTATGKKMKQYGLGAVLAEWFKKEKSGKTAATPPSVSERYALFDELLKTNKKAGKHVTICFYELAKGIRDATRSGEFNCFYDPEIGTTNYCEMDEMAMKDCFELVEYARRRGIFIVFAVTPKWSGWQDGLPFPETRDVGERKFLTLISELDIMENCAVIVSRDFSEIAPELDESTLFLDHHHLGPRGGKVYAEWLGEQMLKHPKIAAALNRPKVKDEYFVKRILRGGHRRLVGLLKSDSVSPKKSSPVKTAEIPSSAPVR